MENVILKTIEQYNLFKENEVVVVAISGGADSMAMLHSLMKLNLSLVVAHVNHQKRSDAILDEQLVQQQSRLYGVPCEVYSLEKPQKNVNFHDYARKKRYEFFKEVATRYQATAIVTAHHADDHLETQVHRFISQGTPAGLIGIEPKTKAYGLNVVRPLINVTKVDIYKYCEEHGVAFREDQSNQSDVYTRNRIRHHIIPKLVEESPSVYKQSRLLSENLSEDEKYFSDKVDKLMLNVLRTDNYLEVPRSFINELPLSLSKRLIRRMLQCFTLRDIQAIHVNELLKLVQSEKPNLQMNLPQGISCIIAYNVLKIQQAKTKLEPYEIALKLNETQILPNYDILDFRENKVDEKTEKSCINKVHLCYNEIELPLKVRTRKPGDRIKLINDYGRKKVKEIMIEEKVPKHLRDTWPLIVDDNDNIIWIPLLKKTAYCKTITHKHMLTIEYIQHGGTEEDE
ncbi:MAG TPA: tRNA lysidine(34) synthetase TilS [Firmicutes bacterium]|nr:tRNA lysidine(34) synthetase TilS [Bacillota bacterium]